MLPFTRLTPIEKTIPSPARLGWRAFQAEVNRKRLSILEIGSRASVLGEPGKRHRFKRASDYVGVDIHPGEGVDIVGDVHRLTSLLDGRRFGAIHSHSVMEHLAMPWVAAVEMIKSLKVGGVMFHHVPMNWPEHEMPWDFYRFTQATFGALFPPIMGMHIEYVGVDYPLHLHMEEAPAGQETLHENRCFAFVCAFMRKTAEVDLSRFSWPVSVATLLDDAASIYPRPPDDA